MYDKTEGMLKALRSPRNGLSTVTKRARLEDGDKLDMLSNYVLLKICKLSTLLTLLCKTGLGFC